MTGMIEKIKEKIHGDKDTHTSTTGTHTGTTGTHAGSDPTGPHQTHAGNKLDPRVDSDRTGAAGNTASAGGASYGTHTTGTHHSDPSGPHDSRLGNKMDPRVDSDRYGASGNTYSATTGTGSHGLGAGHTGSDPTGPHDSRMANKLDPRVDSDQMGGRGNAASTGGYGTTGHSTHTGTGFGTGHSAGSDPSGPHDSRMANKMDPRVDSDRMGAAGNHASTGAYGTTGHSTHTGTGFGTGHSAASDPTGPHDSRMANKLDPRVDTDRMGAAGNHASAGGYGTTGHSTGTTGYGTTGHSTGMTGGLPGPADSTAGPHKSDLLNKADPRVDSDLDGSKKIGGDRTFG